MGILQGASGSEAELPFAIYDGDGEPVEGHVVGTGDLKLRLPGATSFTNANVANVLEVGHGQYVLQLTSEETADEGMAFVVYNDGSNRFWSSYEPIVSDGDELLELPFAVYSSGSPVTEATFNDGDLQVRLPGGAFLDADTGAILECGLGQYVLVLTPEQRAEPGAVFVYFDDGANDRYYGYELNMLDNGNEGGGTDPDPDPTPDPIPVPNPEMQITYVSHVAAALSRFPEYAKQEVL